MRTLLATILAAVTLLAAVPAAQAGTPPDPATQAKQMMQIGEDFWRAKGIDTCPDGVTYRFEDLPEDVYGQASQGGCDLSLDSGAFVYSTRNRYLLRTRCTIVVHEIGHALGLPHGSGVMDVEPIAERGPRVCKTWATQQARSSATDRRARRGPPKGVRRG